VLDFFFLVSCNRFGHVSIIIALEKPRMSATNSLRSRGRKHATLTVRYSAARPTLEHSPATRETGGATVDSRASCCANIASQNFVLASLNLCVDAISVLLQQQRAATTTKNDRVPEYRFEKPTRYVTFTRADLSTDSPTDEQTSQLVTCL
jgi:hypothetical protein